MDLVKSIKIIDEDDDILVIDKPAGMTVNRAETSLDVTVQDWAENRLKVQSRFNRDQNEKLKVEKDSDFYNRGGVVHRLDKETSGVLILAKRAEAFIGLQRQFKERQVKKVYIALAHGRVIPVSGEIIAPVGRLPWNRMRFGVIPGGRESVTKYKVLYADNLYSYLELYPETGRTHQIRVHLKYIGHPIFADFFYAGRKTAKIDRKMLGRVFLHAAKISFFHPKTGEMVSFESELPEELAAALSKLKIPKQVRNDNSA